MSYIVAVGWRCMALKSFPKSLLIICVKRGALKSFRMSLLIICVLKRGIKVLS